MGNTHINTLLTNTEGQTNSSPSMTTMQQSSERPDDAIDAIERRYRAEDWSTHDLFASLLQCSLLSYRSHESCAEIFGDLDRTDAQGPRYVDSVPEDYMHNCPWNDWTPPSQSWAIFERAQANRKLKQEPIDMRVRVRVSGQPAPVRETQVAFASIENNAQGKPRVVVRRGATVLSAMAISTLHAEGVSGNVLQVVLTSTPKNAAFPTASLCLTFENETRFLKFYDMVKAGATSKRRTEQ